MNQEEPSGGWGDEGKDRKKDEEKKEWEEEKDEEKWLQAVENLSGPAWHFLSVFY